MEVVNSFDRTMDIMDIAYDFMSKDTVRFLQLYQAIEYKYFYVIEKLISDVRPSNKKTQIDISILRNLKDLSHILEFSCILNIPIYDRNSNDYSQARIDIINSINNNVEFKLYVLVFENSIKYIIKDTKRLLKLRKVLTNGETLPILIQKILPFFNDAFGIVYNINESDSIITPFINDRNDRNNLTINLDLAYNAFGEDEILNDVNYISSRDGIDTDIDYTELEMSILQNEYSEYEDQIVQFLLTTNQADFFNTYLETNTNYETIDSESVTMSDYDSIEVNIDNNIINLLNEGIQVEEISQRVTINDIRRSQRTILENFIRIDTKPLRIDTKTFILGECCCCFNEEKIIKLIPCNHMVICFSCINTLHTTHNTRKCPICRKKY